MPPHDRVPTPAESIELSSIPAELRPFVVLTAAPLLVADFVGEVIAPVSAEIESAAVRLANELSGPVRVRLARLTMGTGIAQEQLEPLWGTLDDLRQKLGHLGERGVDTDVAEYQLDIDDDLEGALETLADAERRAADAERKQRVRAQLDELRRRITAEAGDDRGLLEAADLIDADVADERLDAAEDGLRNLRESLEDARRESRLEALREARALAEAVDGADHLLADIDDAIASAEDGLEPVTQELVDTFRDRAEQAWDSFHDDVDAELVAARERLRQLSDGLDASGASELEGLLDRARQVLSSDPRRARELIREATRSIDRRYVPVWEPAQGEASLVAHLERFLSGRGMFDPIDVRRLHVSLKTRRFVILAGLTGSGKSTIARGYAEAMGATSERVRRVAVRPNWVDESEVLGFLNPLDNRFHPGWLATLARDCAREPELPHFLILDEMNLAPVEYYLADVLSAIEDVTSPGNRPQLALYPPDAVPENRGDWPPQIEYPRNLFIIGTVNIDESTRAISDRVLDRANVIQLSIDVQRSHHDDRDAAAEEPPWRVRMSAWDKIVHQRPSARFHDQLVEIAETLSGLRIGMGVRSHLEIERFIANAEGVLDEAEALDVALLQRVVPKVRGFRGELADPLAELRTLFESLGATRCTAVVDAWLDPELSDETFLDGTDASVGLATM
ncbi:MAG: hypothetical protein D6683_07695 [Actinomyces sp.]|nr:MAG: hypothetical protein D6683_07695 [Actinomyces sp.]